jgi:hypothetical protein
MKHKSDPTPLRKLAARGHSPVFIFILFKFDFFINAQWICKLVKKSGSISTGISGISGN